MSIFRGKSKFSFLYLGHLALYQIAIINSYATCSWPCTEWIVEACEFLPIFYDFSNMRCHAKSIKKFTFAFSSFSMSHISVDYNDEQLVFIELVQNTMAYQRRELETHRPYNEFFTCFQSGLRTHIFRPKIFVLWKHVFFAFQTSLITFSKIHFLPFYPSGLGKFVTQAKPGRFWPI